MKFLALALLASASLPVIAQQQTTDPNANVFLDNHRPLIPKKTKAPTARTVSGQVTDDTGQPLDGALVTLTDSKTNEKRKLFTKKDGKYQFEDVDFNVDYQLQARWKQWDSEPRKLSQYDHTVKMVRILEIQTPSGPTPDTAAQSNPPPASAKKETTPRP